MTAQRAYEKALKESETNFRLLAENAHEGIFIDRADGAIVYANRHASRLTGYPRRELLESSLDRILSPGDQARVRTYSTRRLNGLKAPARYEVELRTRSGTRVPVEVEVAPTVWQGQPATIGLLRDVRERRQVEQRVLAAARDEQLRLGQELHDSLGSELAGTMFVAKALERRLVREESPAAKAAGTRVTCLFPL